MKELNQKEIELQRKWGCSIDFEAFGVTPQEFKKRVVDVFDDNHVFDVNESEKFVKKYQALQEEIQRRFKDFKQAPTVDGIQELGVLLVQSIDWFWQDILSQDDFHDFGVTDLDRAIVNVFQAYDNIQKQNSHSAKDLLDILYRKGLQKILGGENGIRKKLEGQGAPSRKFELLGDFEEELEIDSLKIVSPNTHIATERFYRSLMQRLSNLQDKMINEGALKEGEYTPKLRFYLENMPGFMTQVTFELITKVNNSGCEHRWNEHDLFGILGCHDNGTGGPLGRNENVLIAALSAINDVHTELVQKAKSEGKVSVGYYDNDGNWKTINVPFNELTQEHFSKQIIDEVIKNGDGMGSRFFQSLPLGVYKFKNDVVSVSQKDDDNQSCVVIEEYDVGGKFHLDFKSRLEFSDGFTIQKTFNGLDPNKSVFEQLGANTIATMLKYAINLDRDEHDGEKEVDTEVGRDELQNQQTQRIIIHLLDTLKEKGADTRIGVYERQAGIDVIDGRPYMLGFATEEYYKIGFVEIYKNIDLAAELVAHGHVKSFSDMLTTLSDVELYSGYLYGKKYFYDEHSDIFKNLHIDRIEELVKISCSQAVANNEDATGYGGQNILTAGMVLFSRLTERLSMRGHKTSVDIPVQVFDCLKKSTNAIKSTIKTLDANKMVDENGNSPLINALSHVLSQRKELCCYIDDDDKLKTQIIFNNLGMNNSVLGILSILPKEFLLNENNKKALINGVDSEGNNLLHLILKEPELLCSASDMASYYLNNTLKTLIDDLKIDGYKDTLFASLINTLSDDELKTLLSQKNIFGMTPLEQMVHNMTNRLNVLNRKLFQGEAVTALWRITTLVQDEVFNSFVNFHLEKFYGEQFERLVDKLDKPYLIIRGMEKVSIFDVIKYMFFTGDKFKKNIKEVVDMGAELPPAIEDAIRKSTIKKIVNLSALPEM